MTHVSTTRGSVKILFAHERWEGLHGPNAIRRLILLSSLPPLKTDSSLRTVSDVFKQYSNYSNQHKVTGVKNVITGTRSVK